MATNLFEIKKRFNATTYGPWKIYENEEGTCIGAAEDHPQLKSPAPVVSMAHSSEGKKIHISKDNADFIAHSKEDVDWLINHIEHLYKFMNDSALSQVSYDIVRDDEDDEN